jgi:hypothetical protein
LLPIELKNEVLQGKSNFSKADIIEVGKNKDVEKVGEVVKELLSKVEKRDSVLKNKKTSIDKKKEKIVSLMKSINSTNDCDKLIVLISENKKLF